MNEAKQRDMWLGAAACEDEQELAACRRLLAGDSSLTIQEERQLVQELLSC